MVFVPFFTVSQVLSHFPSLFFSRFHQIMIRLYVEKSDMVELCYNLTLLVYLMDVNIFVLFALHEFDGLLPFVFSCLQADINHFVGSEKITITWKMHWNQFIHFIIGSCCLFWQLFTLINYWTTIKKGDSWN